MTHPLRIRNKSTLIDERIKEIFFTVRSDYQKGKIKTHTEYLYRIFRSLEEFYNSIGEPTFTERPAWGPPYSSDYNDMIHEIYHDLHTLYAESEQLSYSLEEGFRQVSVDREGLVHRIKKLEDKVSQIKTKATEEAHEVIYHDSFLDESHYNKEMVRGIPAHIWTNEGVLTLSARAQESYLDGAVVRIKKGNGFPGNTKQVKSVEGQLKFIGEEGLHLNLHSILDRNADTWFEYELFEVNTKTLEDTEHLGYNYEEGLKWITNETSPVLQLVMEIELPQVKTVNWFSLSPFIPDDKEAVASRISAIEVHDGKGKVYKPIETIDSFTEEKVYMFGQKKCKKIVVTFEQAYGYDTEIGHLYHKEMKQERMNYFDYETGSLGKRVEGPMPSIEVFGMKYDPHTQEIIHPSSGNKLNNLNDIKSELFQPIGPLQDIQAGYERIQARRYVIGIRDMLVSNYKFDESSEYVSTAYQAEEPIVGVYLTVDEMIPDVFGNGYWIEYFITVDQGDTWHRVKPRGISKASGKTLYLINTHTPNEGRFDQFGYIDLDEHVYDVHLKVLLHRPVGVEGIEYYTPILKDYELHLITEGGELK